VTSATSGSTCSCLGGDGGASTNLEFFFFDIYFSPASQPLGGATRSKNQRVIVIPGLANTSNMPPPSPKPTAHMGGMASGLDHAARDAYIAQLSTHTLDRLQKVSSRLPFHAVDRPREINAAPLQEPELLRMEARKCESSIDNLARDHYKAFVSAAETVHSVHHSVLPPASL